MKKLLALFKNLPPEVRMLLAMAGLGSPIGAIYLLQRFLFPGVPTIYIIFGVAAVVGLIALLGWLIAFIFGRRTRKRTKQMESELARTAGSGPSSIDVRAAIKENTDKFFVAIREMRKNLGVNIYDLPWYIVVGDSGCGKTKLVNESGLIFAAGKPEGYQLGTLNYNWWFTEDAIFIDMAGRLCNPKEESDYREWQAFLDTIARGRKGYPINGALVCVSAEHLLQDPAEKHEEDANTALERLRDLQNKLGVTFATYLVVTKCDKILGFMQFFDRAERDIAVKNQIFGWSKPGAFNDLYDPEQFDSDFGRLYERLHELRLRRLNDDADENELGLACAFPEEFRQLEAPLQTYVRTLFPMIKNPRAMKNLVFRGTCFTSATQQGSVILKHLTERLGADSADMFPTLDSLYPRPRPHFVKDLLVRKVFPENGLVFRNEDQVMRNRKLSKVLKYGSAVMFVVLVILLTWSSLTFSKLIGTPSVHASEAATKVDAPNTALEGAKNLSQDVETLKAHPWPARILSLGFLGFPYENPSEALSVIQMHLFEAGVLRQALGDIDKALRATKLASLYDGPKAVAAADRYLNALEQYVAWYGCTSQTGAPEMANWASFEKMCGLVEDPNSIIVVHKGDFFKQAESYFALAAQRGRNPAAVLTQAAPKPEETIAKGVAQAHDHLSAYARLNEKHPNAVIREWMRIQTRCAQMNDSYKAILGSAGANIHTQEELATFKANFLKNFETFDKAVKDLTWQGDKSGGEFVRIAPIRAALRSQREMWTGYQQKLVDAFRKCSPAPKQTNVPQVLASLVSGGTSMRGLDKILVDELNATHLAERAYFDGFFGENFDKLVAEVDERFGHVFLLNRAGDQPKDETISLTPDAQTVHSVLAEINSQLAAANLDPAAESTASTPAQWIAEIDRRLYAEEDADKSKPSKATRDFSKLNAKWTPSELEALYTAYEGLIERGEGTRLLATIVARLGGVGEWGFAQLLPAYRDVKPSGYVIPIPVADAAPERKKSEPEQQARPTKRKRPSLFGAEPSAEQPVAPTKPGNAPTELQRTGEIPAAATRDFLQQRTGECVELLALLPEFTEEFYFKAGGAGEPMNAQCAALVQSTGLKYMENYVRLWSTAYEKKLLRELKTLERWDTGWDGFAAQFKTGGARAGADPRTVAAEFQPALEEILSTMRWAAFHERFGWWSDQRNYQQQWREASSWFSQAVRDQWKGPPFVVEALDMQGGDARETPWARVARIFAERWMELATSIGKNAKMPRRFDANTLACTPIPWGDIAQLREDLRLGGEKITGELVGFEQQAQKLFNAELTNVLVALQSHYFQGAAPWHGWPYLNEAGKDLTALETLDFDRFKNFLIEVDRARQVFDTLEKALARSLPDDAARRSRERFYAACRAWHDFLGITAQGITNLEVDVWYGDPMTAPKGLEKVDDTAQHYDNTTRLYLGLERADVTAGSTTGGEMSIATTERGEAAAEHRLWRWAGTTGQSELWMDLVDGITPENKETYPNTKQRVLGKLSPLAFPAYLHRYAKWDASRRAWYVSHAISLPDSLMAAGKGPLVTEEVKKRPLRGVKFFFRLNRALPEPIEKLSPAG